MAAASASASDGIWYQCRDCGHNQCVSTGDFEDDDPQLGGRLLEITDSGPLGYGTSQFVVVNSITGIECENCEETIDVVVKVRAKPTWDDSGEHDPRIDNFTDIEILNVLPRDAEEDTSLMNCFVYDDDFEDEWPEIKVPEEPTEVRSVTLQIIAKTRMSRGYCHLGFDWEAGRIYRPLHRTEEARCCWDRPLELDRQYVFQALEFPGESLTPLPHSNEDLLVDRGPTLIHQNTSIPDIFEELESIANSTMEEIFGSEIRENKYVDEGTDCPSVGVLSCRGRDLELVRDPFDNRKRRIKISGGYNPRITAFDARELPEELPDKPTLVVLGLGRPFAGTRQRHFEPRRCYIIVLRILQNP